MNEFKETKKQRIKALKEQVLALTSEVTRLKGLARQHAPYLEVRLPSWERTWKNDASLSPADCAAFDKAVTPEMVAHVLAGRTMSTLVPVMDERGLPRVVSVTPQVYFRAEKGHDGTMEERLTHINFRFYGEMT